MNLGVKSIYLLGWLCCMLISIGEMNAQLSVVADDPKATYLVGIPMNFVVSSDVSGPIHYQIEYDRFTADIKTGVVDHTAGENSLIPYSRLDAGVVLCRTWQGNDISFAGATFGPFDLAPIIEEPDDLDVYWAQEKAELAQIPIDEQIEFKENHEYAKSFRINLATIGGRRVYGYLSIPDGVGPFPGIITLPAFGSSANLVEPQWVIAERGGALSLAISIHNADPEEEDPFAYEPDIINHRDSLYYRSAILAGVRAIDYLFSRPDFNGNLGLAGVSQGGGLAMLIAGVDERVKILAQSNAALCQHAGFDNGLASGFPYFVRKSVNEVGDIAHTQATINATQYIDAVYLAKRFTGPSLHAISYEDTICPPASVFAAYNQLRGPKVLVHARELGHNHPTEFTSGQYDFFRQHFPAMQNPPWPWPDEETGYFVNAGDDFDTAVDEEEHLNGVANLNGEANPNWTALWEQIAGPGTVAFENPTEVNTIVKFSEVGFYELRLTVTDDYDEEEAKYYTMQDYIRVNVLGPTSTDLLTNEQAMISVYPNPGNGRFFLSFTDDLTEHAILSIYNVEGQLIRAIPSAQLTRQMYLDLQTEVAGVYVLRLENAGEVFVKRLVISE